jgi:hypothetical protein
MEWYTLTDDDKALCAAQAAEVVRRCKESDDPAISQWARRHALKKGDLSGEQRLTEGLSAELVVHRALGTEPTWVAGKFDGGKDGVLATGHTWDSKLVRKAARFLLVPPTLPTHADCYLLVKYEAAKDRYRIVGWDYWLRIQRYAVGTVKEEGRKSHKVPAADLRPWEDFERMHVKLVERFVMRVDGMEIPVSINHKHHAVKIGEVVYDRRAWAKFVSIQDLEHRKAEHMTVDVLDGELEEVSHATTD